MIKTSKDLANLVIAENSPCDYSWINYQKRKYNAKQIKEICFELCRDFAPDNFSKNKITRAGKEVAWQVYHVL